MAKRVLPISRKDIWDVGGIGGLLKGELFCSKVEEHLPVKTFEEAPLPLAVTSFDLLRLRTSCITEGNLALAARASCTFPGLLQPTIINGSPHIDGGVWDHDGMMALEACFRSQKRRQGVKSDQPLVPDNKLIVNIVFDNIGSSKLPASLSKCRLLTIVVEQIPGVTPFTMESAGPKAYAVAREATRKALESAHIVELASNHWCCYVDGALVTDDDMKVCAVGAEKTEATFIPLNRASSLSSVSTAVLNGDDGMDTTQITICEEIDGDDNVDGASAVPHRHVTLSGTVELRHPHVESLQSDVCEAVMVHTTCEEECNQPIHAMSDLADLSSVQNSVSQSSTTNSRVPFVNTESDQIPISSSPKNYVQPTYSFINSQYQLMQTVSTAGSNAVETFSSSSSSILRVSDPLERKRKAELEVTSSPTSKQLKC